MQIPDNPPLELHEPDPGLPSLDALTEQILQRGEQFRREAIRETDWSETAVLRIIERQPELGTTAFDPGDLSTFRVPTPQLQVKRYEGRAPPISAHADGTHRYTVETITRPLLERLSEKHPDVFDFLDGVDG